MFQHHLRSALMLAVAGVLAIGTAVAGASSAAAAPDDYCMSPGRYVLLVDPTGAADQALCHVQESTLRQLSEEQWGEEYTADQRGRMLSWGRQDSLGAMYLELLKIASKQPNVRTDDEATVYAWLQSTLAALRSQMAEAAYAEQITFSGDPCGYVPPGPGSSTIQCGNSDSLITLFGPPPGPTYEQFVNYGAQQALAENFGAVQLAMIGATARSARDQLIAAGVGAAGGIGIGVGLVAAATAGMVYTAMLGAITTSTAAATAAVSALGTFVVAAGASVLFVALAVTLAVVRGVQAIEEAQIPDQLRADIAAAKQPVDIVSWIGSDSSRATLLLQAIARRNNTAPAPQPTPPSAPTDESAGFLVTGAADDTTFTQELRYRSPASTETFFTAWLDHGWWVIQDDAGARALTRRLVFVDHDGHTRSASWMTGIGGDLGHSGFLVTTVGVSDSSTDTSGAACTEANGCETTVAVDIVTGPPSGTTGVARNVTATLHAGDIEFTGLPTISTSYEVGTEVRGSASAEADYLTTMSYRWDLTRHDETGDKTTTVNGNSLDATLAFPGSYHLQLTATASSGESAAHGWDFTVVGETDGQHKAGILLTQYAEDNANPADNTPGQWREGTSTGTLCLQTGSDAATDFTIQFAGEEAQTHANVAAGYSCFARPASADKAGTHALDQVKACPSSGTLCWPTSLLIYEDGLWVQSNPFTYTVANLPPTVSDISLDGPDGSIMSTTPESFQHFTVGDRVQATATVTDPGGGPLTVHIHWSDGSEETQTNVTSGSTIDVTHLYDSVAWGPVGVQIEAVDDTGAVGNLATGWFVVHPRLASLGLETEVDSGGLVIVTGTITDPDGTASVFGIDWGDGTGDGASGDTGYRYDAPFPAPLGSEVDTAALNRQFKVTHHYATGGSHTIQAALWNGAEDDEFATASETVTLPNTPPAVVSNDPITLIDDHDVRMDALIGDLNGGDTLTAHADFGDGSGEDFTGHAPGDTVDLTHTYEDGEHTITFTVTDDLGAMSEVQRCFVLADGVITPCEGAIPADDDDIRAEGAGSVTAPESARSGAHVTISLGPGHGNETVTLYLYSTPILLGTFTTDAHGDVTVPLPGTVAAGSHTVAAFVGAALVGWAPITVLPTAGSGGGSGSGSGPETGSERGPDAAGEDSGDTGDGGGEPGGTDSDADSGPGSHHAARADRHQAAEEASEAPALAQTGVRTRELLALALVLLVVGAALVMGSRQESSRRAAGPPGPTEV